MMNVQLELVRKLLHALGGVLVILLVKAGVLTLGILGLLIVVFAAIILVNCKYERELLTKILTINRADKNIPGMDVLSFALGCWIVLACLEQPLAFAAIMILSFGDPLAHLIGGGLGGRATTSRNRYLLGGAGGALAGTLGALMYVPFIPALLASVAAMTVEAGELRIANHHIDDNLTIPLVAGVVLWVINYAFPF
ncbi:MAG: hypothetical protein OXR66_02145 [Candidatus Woesearchaeota archaeon]|nr:hypothetical protein [Candidatus Woesearchaeota archaeon]